MIDNEIEKRIKELSKSNGISIRQVCLKIGMTESGLNRSFKNNSIKFETIQRIAEVFNVSLNEFFSFSVVDDTVSEMYLDFFRRSKAPVVFLGYIYSLFYDIVVSSEAFRDALRINYTKEFLKDKIDIYLDTPLTPRESVKNELNRFFEMINNWDQLDLNLLIDVIYAFPCKSDSVKKIYSDLELSLFASVEENKLFQTLIINQILVRPYINHLMHLFFDGLKNGSITSDLKMQKEVLKEIKKGTNK